MYDQSKIFRHLTGLMDLFVTLKFHSMKIIGDKYPSTMSV